MKKLIVFDLDGTLAASKSAIDPEMATVLHDLVALIDVAVISGGGWPQFETQLLSPLPRDSRLSRLSLLPTCGTKFFRHDDGSWTQLYSEDLSPDEKAKVVRSFDVAIAEARFPPHEVWGDVIEDRGSQITYSALGQHAPLPAKSGWDPDYAKRTKMKAVLDGLMPELSVRMGGATSIDVTKRGIDKGYGIRKLRDVLGVSLEEMLFIGDALFVGGNDYAAKEAGVACIRVRDPEETKRVAEAIIACVR